MPVRFPVPDNDIPLKRAPLTEVICQVKFPRILSLSEREPADFQERIRQHFPVYQFEPSVRVDPSLARAGKGASLGDPVYRFQNQSETKTVSLASEFYSLNTSAYSHWSAFAQDLGLLTDAVRKTYQIPYATRVGLRYINFIGADYAESRQIEDVYEIVRPELTVMLRTEVMPSPSFVINQIQLEDGADQFAFRYGIVREEEAIQRSFLLDFDEYTEGQINLDDLLAHCDRYHDVIYSAFRWCISPEKLAVFEPIDTAAKGGER
jgi:uncharacterized protein (TIGR04255 family)